jgi:hypothetical protein
MHIDNLAAFDIHITSPAHSVSYAKVGTKVAYHSKQVPDHFWMMPEAVNLKEFLWRPTLISGRFKDAASKM